MERKFIEFVDGCPLCAVADCGCNNPYHIEEQRMEDGTVYVVCLDGDGNEVWREEAD